MPGGERAPGVHDLGDPFRRGRIRGFCRSGARILGPGRARRFCRGRALIDEAIAALLLGPRRISPRPKVLQVHLLWLPLLLARAYSSGHGLSHDPRRGRPPLEPALWGLLVVLCGALFLDALDVSMVGVALPSIRPIWAVHRSLQWVVSGYVLGYGGLLLLGGRAADLLGRRRVFLAALAVFAVASLIGGLVSTGPLLIAARLVKGMAAAFTAPAGLSIITTTFAERPARNRALGIYSAFGATGFSLGLVLSGLLTEISWRWTFLLPGPVATVLFIAAVRLIPRAVRERGLPALRPCRRHRVTSGCSSSSTPLSTRRGGWASVTTLLSFAGAAALIGAFVLIEQRSAWSAGAARHLALARSGTRQPRRHALFGSYVSFQFLVTLYVQISPVGRRWPWRWPSCPPVS